jgi:CopG family transcriptional regulator, nickel-responsive regulator
MGQTIRFGVSMDSALVELLDRLTQERGNRNRSDTLRDLVRRELIEMGSNDECRNVIGTVTLLYHQSTQLPRHSIDPYPSLRITANLQFHVEDQLRSKVITIIGKGSEVRCWANQLLSSPHVIGTLAIAATDELYGELNRG